MTDDQIKELALYCGFKLKRQPDGTEDLNSYVYEFAHKLLEQHAKQYVLAGLRGKRVNCAVAEGRFGYTMHIDSETRGGGFRFAGAKPYGGCNVLAEFVCDPVDIVREVILASYPDKRE